MGAVGERVGDGAGVVEAGSLEAVGAVTTVYTGVAVGRETTVAVLVPVGTPVETLPVGVRVGTIGSGVGLGMGVGETVTGRFPANGFSALTQAISMSKIPAPRNSRPAPRSSLGLGTPPP